MKRLASPDAIAAAIERALPGVPVRRDEPMARHTTFGIGGPADFYITAMNEAQLEKVLRFSRENRIELFLIGGGSNLLVGDRGIRGLVLQLGGELAAIAVSEDGARIEAGAGASFPRLTKTAISLGWLSAVGWMGTPGQVGGALVMNAGSRSGEIGDVVESIAGVGESGPVMIARSEIGFSYRNSRFPPGLVLTRAFLQCDDRQTERAQELDQLAKTMLKRRHQSQPKHRSAGSIFKNPPGDYAGRLIEAAGLKGRRCGGAQISDVHANFIVNLGGATASDVIALAELAQQTVADRVGVMLEWEVRKVGEFDPPSKLGVTS